MRTATRPGQQRQWLRVPEPREVCSRNPNISGGGGPGLQAHTSLAVLQHTRQCQSYAKAGWPASGWVGGLAVQVCATTHGLALRKPASRDTTLVVAS